MLRTLSIATIAVLAIFASDTARAESSQVARSIEMQARFAAAQRECMRRSQHIPMNYMGRRLHSRECAKNRVGSMNEYYRRQGNTSR
jgi:hypothetical protein